VPEPECKHLTFRYMYRSRTPPHSVWRTKLAYFLFFSCLASSRLILRFTAPPSTGVPGLLSPKSSRTAAASTVVAAALDGTASAAAGGCPETRRMVERTSLGSHVDENEGWTAADSSSAWAAAKCISLVPVGKNDGQTHRCHLPR